MPWVAADAVHHNARAKGVHAKQWAAVANAVLKKTGDDVRAIKEANAAVNRDIASHSKLKQALAKR